MANIKSALKRAQVAERNRLRNRSYKSAVKTLMKRFFAAVDHHLAQPTPEAMLDVQHHLDAAYSKIDKAVKCGILHPNNGARKKSRLARFYKRCESVIQESSSNSLVETPMSA